MTTNDRVRDVGRGDGPIEPLAGVASPCTSVCRMDSDGVYCVGCFRTLDEIAGWSAFDDERRQQIWDELRRRKAALASQAACERHR